MFEDKRLRIACCLLLVSILLLLLSPEKVTVYRGEYTVISQDSEGTRIYAPDREALVRDFPSGVKDGYVMTGKTLDEVLEKLFTEDYNVKSFFPLYGSEKKKVYPLNKIHVPDLAGTEYTLTKVEFRISSMIFYVAGPNDTRAEITFCDDLYCAYCDAYQDQYTVWMHQGKTDRCIATGTLKAAVWMPTEDLPEETVKFFGKVDGTAFHGTITGPDSDTRAKLASELKLQAVRPTNTPVMWYYLAKAVRPAFMVTALGGAAVLLWMGLAPLRKKQTVPDG